ncbi:unnamed protein product [Rotaria socialis]|uniref:LTD domain-containing protein n=1 Tax=Rotaria socialis TaxID=392032 RepID=A0A817TMI1_9BILA|nr:unnamed protein product [Rotaria socialis]CAF3352280.1 unnamed protein product [Rotaria socialis]CAF4100891.1 unnamed protein product [Rotaria socialis]CAF4835946.1 unnamed protein product [Rotaria socialis]
MSSSSVQKPEKYETIRRETKISNEIVAYRPIEKLSNYQFYYISPLSVKMEQLKTSFSTDYQHEKYSLTELNQRFRYMLDHIHRLEMERSKYIAKVAELRQKSVMASINGKEKQQLALLKADVTKINYAKFDCESEVELFELQTQMYQQMAQIGQQSIEQERLKFEHEVNQSTSALASLRASYAAMERTVGTLRTTFRDTIKQYTVVAKDLAVVKKQARALQFSLQMGKLEIKFSKALYSKTDCFSMDMNDFAQFWKVEREQIIKKIRGDFEVLYAAIQKDITTHYQKKTKQMQIDLERATDSEKFERLECGKIFGKLQIEYQEEQNNHSYEKAALLKAQSLFSKLESEVQAIKIQNEKRFEAQLKHVESLNENILIMTSNVEEMERKKIFLAHEIIIYRHLLGKSDMQKTVETTIKKARTYVETLKCGGSIGIECPLECTYIAVKNQSTGETVDISRWRLIRRVDSKVVFKYTIPNETQVRPGSEFRVYSRLGAEVAQLSSSANSFLSSSFQKITMNDVFTMSIGDRIETQLLNEGNQEVALCIQVAETDWEELL